MQKNNTVIIVIAGVIIVVIGMMLYTSGRNKAGAPVAPLGASPAAAVDSHGHPIGKQTPATSLAGFINKPAADFSLADRNGKMYSLRELRGKNVILFFNEGLMCYPACWNQIVSLAKDARFKDSNTEVLSVVVDPPQDWRGAIDKMPELAEATVVFDTDTSVSRQFGMLTNASSMHYGSLPGHTYMIIDTEGIIRNVFDDPTMSIHNDHLFAEIARLN
ncbi:hypothetical protein A2Z10_02700 [Candidatus Azambacteria bacterium RBG_16_47_10]|uniref:Thioredoxin domain-containing protein n=1 Tax=Candidatus Azambacteria bacterium RBG_16_47_10 TaxID=1797292 RepID=A0A1F5B0Y8_9BACT|nr:MAG: hypothetical protein A2Z10_02700 [Candidatus Azambacteria bacterium RBG_16_47_10]